MKVPRILATPGAEAYTYPLIIRHLLAGAGQHAGSLIVSGARRYSYSNFVERVGRLATMLQQLGVGPGDTVAVMDWDSHRYLECYFAVPMMGAILQTVNVRLSPEQIAFTLRNSGANIVLYNADFASLADVLLPQLPQVRQTVRMHDDAEPGTYEALLAAADSEFAFSDFDENAIATTFHTTGTTGDPKQVFFTHRQLVLQTLSVAAALASQPEGQGFGGSDIYMPITPMFHVHAWGFPYVATLLGVKQVYPGRYDPATLLALKQREGVTFSHCVPTILRMLIDEIRGTGGTLAPWKMVIGGSAMAPALAEEAQQVGISAIAGYGMSETGPVVSIARARTEGDLPSRCRAGFPVPLVYARRDEERGGELLLRTPWLTQGYATQEASDALWSGGWLHTGDIAEVDSDGALRIVDRLKDVIKSGGEWISSVELEARLAEHEGVAEVAVIGVPDERWGERPAAFIVQASNAARVTPETLRDHLASYAAAGCISRYAVPDHFLIIPSLPRTSVGKIDKKALRQQWSG